MACSLCGKVALLHPIAGLGLNLCDDCYEKIGHKLESNRQAHEAELLRLSKKAIGLSKSDQEHVFNAGTVEAIKLLADKKRGGEKGEKIGSLYFNDGTAIAIYKNSERERVVSVFGHSHRMVTIPLETKADVKRFALKMNRLLGVKVSKTKRGQLYAYLGTEK